MDSKPVRRKSINLFLLIIIVLAIIALIIISIYLINRPFEENDDTDENIVATSSSEYLPSPESLVSNQTILNNSEYSNSILNSLNDFEDLEDMDGNTIQPENVPITENTKALTLNGHKLNFNNSEDATIVQNANISELKVNYTDFNFKMLLNTDKQTTFENLKKNTSLKSYLESTYNISITSSLKSGNINNSLDIIICTISDANGPAYFIITPLNNSEILYSKIYNTSNSQALIDDLSKPLDEISSMITKFQD